LIALGRQSSVLNFESVYHNGVVAKWLRQGSAKPSSWVQIPSTPLKNESKRLVLIYSVCFQRLHHGFPITWDFANPIDASKKTSLLDSFLFFKLLIV
jgi:hypothetical protein